MKITNRIEDLFQGNLDLSAILSSEASPETREDRLLGMINNADIAFAGLTIGDFVYDALRIDTTVLEAADFVRTQDLGNIFKFSVFADKLHELPGESFSGHVNQIKGYVAERLVAQNLQSAGMEVEFPDSPGQPGYDLLVNGEQFQVKCLADKDGVLNHFEKYPDIPVFVNEELVGDLADIENVYPIEGLSNDGVEEATRESIDSGDELLDYEIPYIALAVEAGRMSIQIIRGKIDLKHGAINVAYNVAGRTVGGQIGSSGLALCGGLLGPYGVVVGGLVGAIGGSVLGKRLLGKVKRTIHTSKERKEAEDSLCCFLSVSHESSLKSRGVFDRKKNDLFQALKKADSDTGELTQYVKRRLDDDTNYLEDKIEKLSRCKDSPYDLGDDILLAGMNGISLAIKAKVHPSSVKKELNELLKNLTSIKDKRSKLF